MKRVLIVDDAIDLARLLQDALKIEHPEIPVSVVPSAEEALLESSRFTIDLLVTDLRLPGISGIELIRKIRVRQPNIKVVLMTGLSPDDRLNKQITETAPEAFIRKPLTSTAFLKTVEQLIGESEAPVKPAAETQPAKVDQDAVKAAVLLELAAVLPGEPVEAKPALARKATGALALEPAPAPVETGVSAILSRLRGVLGALSVILLDENGRPVAQAGDLPDQSLEELVPPMMTSLSASAKVSYLLGQSSTFTVQAYHGIGLDLVIEPVGQYVLLIALRVGPSRLRLALAFEEALGAQTELSAALEAMGLHIQSPAEAGGAEIMRAEKAAAVKEEEGAIPPEILETPLGQDPDLEKFSELFSRKKTGELRLEDPDTFWEAAAGDSKEVSQPGVLSFEQAQKLGLVPPEDET